MLSNGHGHLDKQIGAARETGISWRYLFTGLQCILQKDKSQNEPQAGRKKLKGLIS